MSDINDIPVHIHDGNIADFQPGRVIIDGEVKGHGLRHRNYDAHPPGYLAAAPVFPDSMLIPESEWQSRLDDQIANRESLFDLREEYYDVLKSLDQDGLGLCWAFSTTKAMMYLRLLMNEPGLIMSAWWVAGKVKGWRDEGGWGAESLAFVTANGVPAMASCPSYKSSYDTAETRANAALHKATKWYDGTDSRAKNKQIMISAFLLGLPPVLDYNNISHSMCGCRLVDLKPTIDTDNSWGTNSGTKGLMRLQGNAAIPDGVCVPYVEMA